jgi:hypothetical protein
MDPIPLEHLVRETSKLPDPRAEGDTFTLYVPILPMLADRREDLSVEHGRTATFPRTQPIPLVAQKSPSVPTELGWRFAARVDVNDSVVLCARTTGLRRAIELEFGDRCENGWVTILDAGDAADHTVVEISILLRAMDR